MCKSSIRCFACRQRGHISLNCMGNGTLASSGSRGSERNGKKALGQNSATTLETDLSLGLQRTGPPIFNSFSAWAKFTQVISQSSPTPAPVVVQWPDSMTHGPNREDPHQIMRQCFAKATDRVQRSNPSPSTAINCAPSGINSAAQAEQRKPHSAWEDTTLLQPFLHKSPSQNQSQSMAFQRADPTPFKPRGFQVQDIPNRPMMVRAVARRRPARRNEDLAIATISPLPGNHLHFPVVEEILREFLEQYRRTRIVDVQPTHLGQAFVRFDLEQDRDRFVLDSPHAYGDVFISFVRHNQGRNWRRVYFNHECWLMLMGLPKDYWEREHIDTVLGPYATTVTWHNDPRNLARLIVKARVVDLEDIPYFVLFSDPEGHEGESWTVQCEIPKHENLGAGPPDEEPVPPPPVDMGPPMYDFFGLGQQVLAPVAEHGQQNEQQGLLEVAQNEAEGQGNGLEVDHQEQHQDEWKGWLEELHALVQAEEPPAMQPNLNVAPVALQQDLNEPPIIAVQDLNLAP